MRDKVSLYLQFTARRPVGPAEVYLLGGSYFRHMDPSDLRDHEPDERLAILQSAGQTDLTDMDSRSVRALAEAAVSEFAGSGDINATAVLFLGGLFCGLSQADVTRMTPDALSDALPQVSLCPDVTPSILRALRRAMEVTLNLSYSDMDAADISQGGVALLSDCDKMDIIPDAAQSEALKEAVRGVSAWSQGIKRRRRRWRDPASGEEEDQEGTRRHLRCSLRKMLGARSPGVR
ncbi:uncharacterized protein LOC143291423 [Babylonia areolata]|uniref:uncharacterized protein LOC143291423 n=1 Tax=Babylonia areolata TaxID=304850 RepID=UPI003FD52B48